MKDDNLLTVRVDTVNKGTLDGTILLAPRLLGLRLEKRGDRTLWLYFDYILLYKRLSWFLTWDNPGVCLTPNLALWTPLFKAACNKQNNVNDLAMSDFKGGRKSRRCLMATETQPESPSSSPPWTAGRRQPAAPWRLPRPPRPPPPSSPPQAAPQTCRQNSATESAPQAWGSPAALSLEIRPMCQKCVKASSPRMIFSSAILSFSSGYSLAYSVPTSGMLNLKVREFKF